MTSSRFITNKYNDDYDNTFPQGNKFIDVVRQRCIEADKNLSQQVWFRNLGDRNIDSSYICINGTSMYEIFVSIMVKYFLRIDGLVMIEFKIPRFGLETCKFQISKYCKKWWDDKTDYNDIIPGVDVLHECIKETYMSYHYRIIQNPFVEKKKCMRYLPTILVCSRTGIPQEVEDIIHAFLGNVPINRFRSVCRDTKEVIENKERLIDTDISEHFRVWNNVNRIIWGI